MYIPITLKRKSGKIVKSWHVNGAHNLEEVLHFIWRDLFLSILATGTRRQVEQIPDMLEDIEDVLSWTALERLLYGGRKGTFSSDCPDPHLMRSVQYPTTSMTMTTRFSMNLILKTMRTILTKTATWIIH